MRHTFVLLVLAGCAPGTVTLEDSAKTPGGNDPVDSDSVASGSIEVSPVEADLGITFVGGVATLAIEVTNVGDGPVEVSLSVVGGHTDAWTADAWTSAPEPGATFVHTLTLTPTTWGDHSVSVVVEDALSKGRIEVPITAQGQVDGDGDGFGSAATGGDDCDDARGDVNPDAPETWYDGLDSDCDGADDFDQDGDGVPVDEDCLDTDPTVHPGAADTWYDGVDSDCGGNDDYDQDADGFVASENEGLATDGLPGTGHLPGGDCDDTDAAVNPGATETWYDGVDADCDGADDFDQDADGSPVDADCDDTDASVFPGAPDTWYDGVDSNCDGADDYDQDGDGVDSPTDCNDTDPTITGPTAESWNGIDDDCDGYVDDLSAADAASGILYGASSNLYVGDHGTLALDADLDGDAAPDLVVVTDGSRNGTAWIVDGATAASVVGDLPDHDIAEIAGDSSTYPMNWVNGPFADLDDDGTHDLLIGGGTSDYGRVYGFSGGGGFASADARWSGDSETDLSNMGAAGDLDGDGVAEVIIGSMQDNYGSGTRDAGTLAIFEGGTLDGDHDLGDSVDRIYGDHAYDYLGSSLVVADMDGDGRDDVLAGSSGYDGAAGGAGIVYLIPGTSSLEWETFAGDAASASFEGATANTGLGGDTLAHPGDIDGDGALDLGLTSESRGEAWVYLAAGARSGTTTLVTADYRFSGNAGDLGSMMVLDSDLDGDGADDVCIGADGDSTAAEHAGAVFVFSWSSAWASALTATDARATVWGDATNDYFGTGGAGGQDLDGDGREDLVVGAAQQDGGASNGGAVYVIRGI